MMKLKSEILIVGGGPAGMTLAFLLVKHGIKVHLIERNPDFEREFRGEVLQPRFWHAVKECGLLELFQSIAHEDFDALRLFAGGKLAGLISAKAIDSEFAYITWMTQPHMLRELLDQASKHSEFSIEFDATIKSIVRLKNNKVVVTYNSKQKGLVEVTCNLIVGSDGRFSTVRRLCDFKLAKKVHQFDVLWFEAARPASYTHGADFFIGGVVNCLVLPKYPNKIQCGIIIPPDSASKFRELGTHGLATKLNDVHPMFSDFSTTLVDYKSSTVLSAVIERVDEWAQPGVLLIGDAAHTMSPAGALGVTIAIETAIVAHQVILKCHEKNDYSADALSEVQNRRMDEVVRVQKIQERIGRILTLKFVPRKILNCFITFMIKYGIAVKFMRSVLTRKPEVRLLS